MKINCNKTQRSRELFFILIVYLIFREFLILRPSYAKDRNTLSLYGTHLCCEEDQGSQHIAYYNVISHPVGLLSQYEMVNLY